MTDRRKRRMHEFQTKASATTSLTLASERNESSAPSSKGEQGSRNPTDPNLVIGCGHAVTYCAVWCTPI